MTGKLFYDKLTFVYLEMPKFNKPVDELETNFEKWLYLLKNLNRLDRIPDKLKTKIFMKFLEVAEIAKLSPDEAREYEDSLKVYRDWHNITETTRREAREEGLKKAKRKAEEEGEERTAIAFLRLGVSIEMVMQATGFSEKKVKAIAKKYGLNN